MGVIIKVLVAIGVLALIGILMALPVMWLWNWLMPEIFGMETLTFWEALGVSLLSNLLFKGTYSSK